MISKIVVLIATGIWLVGTVRADDRATTEYKSEAEKLYLIGKLMEKWGGVTRWLIEYEAVPLIPSPEFLPVHRSAAVSSPGLYHHFSAHFPEGGNPWQHDPFTQETFIREGRITHRWPFNRAYEESTIASGSYLGGTTWMDVLWRIVPYWPLTDYKMPANPQYGIPSLLIDAVQSPSYRLLAEPESIGGERCSVFENKGVEKIWIASEKGLCLMRCDILDRGSGRVAVRYSTDRLREFVSGVWLPAEYRIQFLRSEAGAKENLIKAEHRVSILRCSLNNEVPDSEFIPFLRPGSILHDKDKNFTQVVPGGEDLLEDVINFMVKYVGLPTRPVARNHSFAWIPIGVLCGVGVGLVLIRKTGEKTPVSPNDISQ